jgi:tetratricopeptide (TPR) repeat protein
MYSMKCFFFAFLCFSFVASNAQSDSALHYYTIAKQAFSERKFQLAEKNYLKSLTFDAKNATAQVELGLAYVEMRKYAQAINFFKEVEKIEINNTIALDNIATLSYMTFRWEDAITYGKKCVDMKIGKQMHYKIAKSYYNQEDYGNSSKHLQLAANEEPNNADIPYTMANIWLDMSNVKKAVEMFEIALSLDSTKSDWYYETAVVYDNMNDFKKAIPYYEKALAKGLPSDLQVQTTIGMAYINNGSYAKGVEIMEKVIAKKPMDKRIFNDMGYAFYNAKKYKDAIKWWDEILRFDKQDAKVLYMIGIAFQKDGDTEKGNRLCDIAIGMDPSLASLKKEQQMPGGMGL